MVTEYIITEHPDIVLSDDIVTIRRIISQFTAPGRIGDGDRGVFMCHWMPLTRKERGKLKEYRKQAREDRNASSDVDEADVELLDVFDGETFCRVGDLPQYSMDVLAALFDDFGECRKVDIYSRRVPITDSQGRRLGGTDPYADDRRNVPSHHAHAKAQLEDCKGDWVCLAGSYVKTWFEALWGPLGHEQGKHFKIGGRMRRVYHIDHMEYLRAWAKPDRLEVLRSTLQCMNALSSVRISTTWIDDRLREIASRTSEERDDEPKPIKESIRVDVAKIKSYSGHFSPAGLAKLIATRKSLWSDPEWKAKQSEAVRVGHAWNQDMTEEERTTLSETWSNANKTKWAQPGYREKTSLAIKAGKAARKAKDEENGVVRKYKRTKEAPLPDWTSDVDDPKLKKAWNDRVAAADKWARSLSKESLDEFHERAHMVMRIDLHGQEPESGRRQALNMLQNRLIYNLAIDIGQPKWTAEELEKLYDDHKEDIDTQKVSVLTFKRGLAKERLQWLHLAAVLRLKGTAVNFEENPHLQWLSW